MFAGGASAVQQYLAAGLLDELYLHIVPILLGAGERLLEGVGDPEARTSEGDRLAGSHARQVPRRPLGRSAARAWTALRAPDPLRLGSIVRTPSPELRFLGEAFDRLSREYPSTRDGLSLTERRILAAIAEGAETAGAAFVRTGAREARPFLGDTWCFDKMTRFVAAPVPLLDAEPGPVARHTRLRVTDAGRRVLDGQEDHVALNGVDRWIGGVHVKGHEVPWRWNEGTESITAARSPSSKPAGPRAPSARRGPGSAGCR